MWRWLMRRVRRLREHRDRVEDAELRTLEATQQARMATDRAERLAEELRRLGGALR